MRAEASDFENVVAHSRLVGSAARINRLVLTFRFLSFQLLRNAFDWNGKTKDQQLIIIRARVFAKDYAQAV